MRLAILTCNNPKTDEFADRRYPDYSTGSLRLLEVARARGHEALRLYTPRFCFVEKGGRMDVWYDGNPFQSFDAIIYRPNFIEEPTLHFYVPELLKKQGERILNGAAKIVEVKNKMMQHVRLMEAGIPMPGFAFAKDPEAAKQAVDILGFPLIVKVSFGTHGKGVFYAANWETFQPILDYLDVRDGNPVILEEFIAAAQNKDVRAFVVGGRVVASMERRARGKDIRANASLGGKGTVTQLSKEDEQLAIKVAKVFDLDIAGVDLIFSERGTLVLEVNANPGFQELEACTGIDVAGAIVEYAEQYVAKSSNNNLVE